MAQIRAAISIIMAAVKCAVYELPDAEEQRATALLAAQCLGSESGANNGARALEPANYTLFEPALLAQANQQSEWRPTEPLFNRSDYSCYGLLGNQQQQRVLAAGDTGRHAMLTASAAQRADWRLGSLEPVAPGQRQQHLIEGDKLSALSVDDANRSLANKTTAGQSLAQAHKYSGHLEASPGRPLVATPSLAPSAKWPLKIINYFLLTWNGTRSAHDAISRLQVSCLRLLLLGAAV